MTYKRDSIHDPGKQREKFTEQARQITLAIPLTMWNAFTELSNKENIAMSVLMRKAMSDSLNRNDVKE